MANLENYISRLAEDLVRKHQADFGSRDINEVVTTLRDVGMQIVMGAGPEETDQVKIDLVTSSMVGALDDLLSGRPSPLTIQESAEASR